MKKKSHKHYRLKVKCEPDVVGQDIKHALSAWDQVPPLSLIQCPDDIHANSADCYQSS